MENENMEGLDPILLELQFIIAFDGIDKYLKVGKTISQRTTFVGIILIMNLF
ncbi:hypothetical protein [Facklamia sp. P12934]|uniref:hypothetical protein n=1 Tax=Facklamia sp. P12934 TaxID=3421948 RepID=UPI003D163711